MLSGRVTLSAITAAAFARGGLWGQGRVSCYSVKPCNPETVLQENMKHIYMVESLLSARRGHDNDKIDNAHAYCFQFVSRMGRASSEKSMHRAGASG
jgi:hypothetical protein